MLLKSCFDGFADRRVVNESDPEYCALRTRISKADKAPCFSWFNESARFREDHPIRLN